MAAAAATQKNKDLGNLRQIIADNFSDDELRSLCFDMGIEYDDLPGERRAGKARELVRFCDTRDRMSELLNNLFKLRPNIFFGRQRDEQFLFAALRQVAEQIGVDLRGSPQLDIPALQSPDAPGDDNWRHLLHMSLDWVHARLDHQDQVLNRIRTMAILGVMLAFTTALATVILCIVIILRGG